GRAARPGPARPRPASILFPAAVTSLSPRFRLIDVSIRCDRPWPSSSSSSPPPPRHSQCQLRRLRRCQPTLPRAKFKTQFHPLSHDGRAGRRAGPLPAEPAAAATAASAQQAAAASAAPGRVATCNSAAAAANSFTPSRPGAALPPAAPDAAPGDALAAGAGRAHPRGLLRRPRRPPPAAASALGSPPQ
ncbi:hypothetical protein KUF71_003295, partial [Frankliniella fusca]